MAWSNVKSPNFVIYRTIIQCRFAHRRGHHHVADILERRASQLGQRHVRLERTDTQKHIGVGGGGGQLALQDQNEVIHGTMSCCSCSF